MYTNLSFLYFFVYLFLHQQVSTNSIAPSSLLCANTTHNNSSISSDEALTLEKSSHVFKTFYEAASKLSTLQLINPKPFNTVNVHA